MPVIIVATFFIGKGVQGGLGRWIPDAFDECRRTLRGAVAVCVSARISRLAAEFNSYSLQYSLRLSTRHRWLDATSRPCGPALARL